MSILLKSSAESRFYVDIEHGDVFEEGADGVRQVAGHGVVAFDEFKQAAQSQVRELS